MLVSDGTSSACSVFMSRWSLMTDVVWMCAVCFPLVLVSSSVNCAMSCDMVVGAFRKCKVDYHKLFIVS